MPPDEVARRYSHRQTKLLFEMATMGWWRDHAQGANEPNWDEVFGGAEPAESTRFVSAMEEQKARRERFRYDSSRSSTAPLV